MNIYFSAAVTQRDAFIKEYKTIKATIQKLGHTYNESFDVFHTSLDTILAPDVSKHQEYFLKWDNVVKKSDIAIIEASFPSTVHIGLEISTLVDLGKPTICLYKQSRAPMFIHKFLSNRLIFAEYETTSLEETLAWSIEEASQWISRRFTFFLPPHLDARLDTIQKTKHISKSEYIRSLIEKDTHI